MVELSDIDLDRTFQALANSTRRSIIVRLGQSDATVSELADPFEMSIAAVSKHLMILEDAGLITRSRVGRTTRCRLVPEKLTATMSVIDEMAVFWHTQLDALESHLEESDAR